MMSCLLRCLLRSMPIALIALIVCVTGCATTSPEGARADDDAGPASGAPAGVREQGSLVLDGIPAIPPDVYSDMRPYRSTRSASLRGWMPGGQALVSTRFGEVSQVHLVQAPGAARRQLTFFAEPVAGATPSPDRARPGVLYRRDAGGSEFDQLYFLDLASGASRLLTDGRSRNRSAIWSTDGKRIAYASTRRNGIDTDVWIGDLDPTTHRVLTRRAGSWSPEAFSADGTRLLVRRYVSRSESTAWIVDLDDGAMTSVLANDAPVRIDDLAFGPDDESVYLTSDLGGEFVRLYRVPRPGSTPEAVTGDVAHDVEQFGLSPDGRWLAWVMNEDTLSRLYVRDLRWGSFVALPPIPSGVISDLAFAPDGSRLGFTLNGSTSPADVHAIDLQARRLTRWTDSEIGGLDAADLVAPEHFRYETFDTVGDPDGDTDGDTDGDPVSDPIGDMAGTALAATRTVPAYIYRPRRPAGERAPVIVSIHGGPESQSRPRFSGTIQYWVNELGAAVIRPNVRGSTGYGRSYHRLDDGMGREDSVRDICALLDWIAAQPDLDPERVVVQGGSYGGYMVLAAMTLYPERIAAGVETVGISNFVTFLENTQGYRRDLRREEYGDERDPTMRAFLEQISPLGRVARIDAPLLVMQGANDPRVPASESEQIVREVRAAGKEVWYLLARDEGHGFRKRGNQDAAAAVTAMFLERVFEGR